MKKEAITDAVEILAIFEQMAEIKEDSETDYKLTESLYDMLLNFRDSHYQEFNSLSVGLANGCRAYLKNLHERGKIPFPESVWDTDYTTMILDVVQNQENRNPEEGKKNDETD